MQVAQANAIIEAGLLDETALHCLPQLPNALARRSLLVVGGIHGNELHAMEGAVLLLNHLRSGSPLAALLRSRASFHVMPVANSIGALAGARCCPVDPCAKVQWNGQRVVVADDEKGGMKPPLGWADPNRGWDTNQTLAKSHIERAIKSSQPQAVIFTHDWAAPQGIVVCYTDEQRRDSISAVRDVFARLYPTKHIFGTPWEFIRDGNSKENEANLTYFLMQRGLPCYVLENYLFYPRSARCHLALCLFLLAKEALVDLTDAQLVQLIIAESALNSKRVEIVRTILSTPTQGTPALEFALSNMQRPEDRQSLLSGADDASVESAANDELAVRANSAALDMPVEVQQHLKTLLALDEKLLLIEQPLFWPSHGPLLLITGSVVTALVIFAIVDFTGFLGSGLMIVASALALFGMTVWTVISHKHLFIALTDKHVILGVGSQEHTKFKYEDMVSVGREINYLHFCRPEIAIRRKTKSPKPKVEFIDSIASLDRAEDMIRARLKEPTPAPAPADPAVTL